MIITAIILVIVAVVAILFYRKNSKKVEKAISAIETGVSKIKSDTKTTDSTK